MSIERFSRQIRMPEIGREGQDRLSASRVLVAGLGGLGSPAALYLAAAGIGEIGLLDNDRVAESNLNRQTLFVPEDVGESKTEKVRKRLELFNPETIFRVYSHGVEELSDKEAAKFDIIVDCLDNIDARRRLNELCLSITRPLVHGAVRGFSGQMTCIIPYKSPCLDCFSPWEDPSRNQIVGVIGATPGVIGALQAMETIKVLLGDSGIMAGRLLVFDGWAGSFEVVSIERDENCPACGKNSLLRFKKF